MAIIDNKILTPITYVQDLSRHPTPSETMTDQQLKAKFDQGAEDLRIKHNSLIDNIITDNVTSNSLITSANTKADNAVITANGASSVANSASTNATNAVNTANNANGNATTALSTANTASTTATNANTTATNVQTDYNAVKPTLLQAVVDVNSKVDKSYVDNLANNFTLGIIPNDSLTNAKMANEMKKSVVGGVASQNDLATLNNSVTTSLADNSTKLGDLTTLSTTSKVVTGAINELFQSANNGKTSVASAITTKGVSASSTDTFSVLATKIGQIQQGHGNAIASDLLLGKTASSDVGDITGTLIPGKNFIYISKSHVKTNATTYTYTILNVPFTPSLIFAIYNNSPSVNGVSSGLSLLGCLSNLSSASVFVDNSNKTTFSLAFSMNGTTLTITVTSANTSNFGEQAQFKIIGS